MRHTNINIYVILYTALHITAPGTSQYYDRVHSFEYKKSAVRLAQKCYANARSIHMSYYICAVR